MSFEAQLRNRFIHQAHGAQGMAHAGMVRSGINKMGESQLLDPVQPLEIWMRNNAVNEFVADIDESEYRVVDYFSFGIHFNRLLFRF
jgi:hypothetical protein